MNAQEKMLPLPRKSDYLTAMERSKARGFRLASNVLHDDLLQSEEGKRGLGRCYPAWAREILVYEGRYESFRKAFRKGEDIVDKGTGWVLPASYIPPDVFCSFHDTTAGSMPGHFPLGLLVDPESVENERGRVVVHPSSIEIIWRYPFFVSSSMGIVEFGLAGSIDSTTDQQSCEAVEAFRAARRYMLLDRMSIRPIGRANEDPDEAITIFGNSHPSAELSVILERHCSDGKAV